MIEKLRRQPATQRTPMIVLTARHGADATAEGLAAGADDYITKPFSTELLARVHANHELARLRETAVSRAEARGEQIRAGLESNRIIGTAIGILMANHHLTAATGVPAAGRGQPTQQPQSSGTSPPTSPPPAGYHCDPPSPMNYSSASPAAGCPPARGIRHRPRPTHQCRAPIRCHDRDRNGCARLMTSSSFRYWESASSPLP